MDEKLQKRSFIVLLILVSAAFFWLLRPFFDAIFWAAVIAIVAAPVHRRLRGKLGNHASLAAAVTLLLCLVMVIVPVLFILFTFVREGVSFYHRLQTGEIDIAGFLDRLRQLVPHVKILLDRVGMTMESLNAKVAEGAMAGSGFLAGKVLTIGQNTVRFAVSFVLMLYLLFFFLRDGEQLVHLFIRALPLGDARERVLFARFSEMTRATVRGTLLVAVIQGALGGFIFWLLGIREAVLWGVVMALLSLLPAFGAALIWVPVAIYLLVIGAVWQGIVLVLFGSLVISLVDNVLRPIFVGRDTRLPDYLVLLSSLGGIWLFGLSGFMVGPLLAALFIAFWGIFMREFEV
ncbi:MAG: AI-2E family transporter [Desulfobacteraceae bacterium]|nr:AI-2E family transporter [Desulfobacteraceae bacterium]